MTCIVQRGEHGIMEATSDSARGTKGYLIGFVVEAEYEVMCKSGINYLAITPECNFGLCMSHINSLSNCRHVLFRLCVGVTCYPPGK